MCVPNRVHSQFCLTSAKVLFTTLDTWQIKEIVAQMYRVEVLKDVAVIKQVTLPG